MVEMACLIGPPEHSLELTPVRYQFPHILDDRFDSNWLIVRVTASDGARRWTTDEPAFLTGEVARLIHWLRALADGSQGAGNEFAGIEPCLEFISEGHRDATRLRACFDAEFHPSKRHFMKSHDKYSIEFLPGIAGLARFADELEEELRQFPQRGDSPQ